MHSNAKDYDQAVDLYNLGMSIEQVADYYGVTRQSMWMSLQRRGVIFRDKKKYGEDNHFYRGTKANERAHNIVDKAILNGRIQRQSSCQKCGSSGTFRDGRTSIQAHHCDYNKPLDVMWLCQRCHHEWHKHNKAKEVMPSESMPRATITVLSGGFP